MADFFQSSYGTAFAVVFVLAALSLAFFSVRDEARSFATQKEQQERARTKCGESAGATCEELRDAVEQKKDRYINLIGHKCPRCKQVIQDMDQHDDVSIIQGIRCQKCKYLLDNMFV